MPRKPDIGNVALYPKGRPLRAADANGYVLQFYCPIKGARVRRSCGTRDARAARSVQRECRDRLINGAYVASGGAVTQADEARVAVPSAPRAPDGSTTTWAEAAERYRERQRKRRRRKATVDSDSRLDVAGRIFAALRGAASAEGVALGDCLTLEGLERLQDRLLEGAEGRYPSRSPATVNSMMGAVLAFARHCKRYGWIDEFPAVEKLPIDDPMKGRPVTAEEFGRMLDAVSNVVGEGSADSWRFALRVLWETGFRIADLMDFSWDDVERIHPVWPSRPGGYPTLVIPSTQKNGRTDEIPMLPGLLPLLEAVPRADRTGFVADPRPVEFTMRSQRSWFQPSGDALASLAREYGNRSIGAACGVSDQTVKSWLAKLGIERAGKVGRYGARIPEAAVAALRDGAPRRCRHVARTGSGRLTTERASRVIARIGAAAKVVVRAADASAGRRLKFAGAHDLRRGVALRLIDEGVSAETLMRVMRHDDFATTQKWYGATRSAQAAAAEIHAKLARPEGGGPLVGRFVGRE